MGLQEAWVIKRYSESFSLLKGHCIHSLNIAPLKLIQPNSFKTFFITSLVSCTDLEYIQVVRVYSRF